jgi:hypothetical protein
VYSRGSDRRAEIYEGDTRPSDTEKGRGEGRRMSKEIKTITEAIRKIACKCGSNLWELQSRHRSVKNLLKTEDKEAITVMDLFKNELANIESHCGINTVPYQKQVDIFIQDIKSDKWEQIENKWDELTLSVLRDINSCGFLQE